MHRFEFQTNENASNIRYGIWDCVDISSPCSNQTWLALDTETYICDGIDGNTCNNAGIVCNEPTLYEEQYPHPPRCNLLCIGDGTCQNTTFQCNHGKRCEVVCSGEDSCDGLIVRGEIRDSGERFMNQPMNIICGKDGNNGACKNGNFSAPYRTNYNFALNVNAFGTNNLRGTKVYGPQRWGVPLNVQCNYNQSCQGGMFMIIFMFHLL